MQKRKIKDSGIKWIGDIPEHWEIKRIQYVLQEVNQKNNPVKTEQVLSLVKDKGVMLYEDKGNQGNRAKEDVSEYKLAYPQTLIVNSMNILIGSVGISNYFGCVSPVYYVFKDTEKSDLRFINYIFNTREFQNELRKYAKGILEIRLRVSANDIFKQKIALPSKIYQQKIADFLDEKCKQIDLLIQDIQCQIETLEEYKKSVITETVTKGLNPNVKMKDSGVEWIGEIPEEWEISRLGYECYIRARLGWRGLKSEEYVEEGYVFLSAFNIQNNKMDWSEVNYITKKRYDESPEIKLHIGDVLIVKDGAGIGKIARIDVLPLGDATPNSSLAVLTSYGSLLYSYLSYYLQTSIFSSYIFSLLNGMGVPHLTQNVLKNVSVLVPSLTEQQQIVEYLDKKCEEIDSIISTKKEQLEVLQEYKKSVIYEYVTGKKEVE